MSAIGELENMLKAAREEAATYRIKAREKEEARKKLEALENEITHWKTLYQHFKSKYEVLTLARIDDPYLPISEKQKEAVKLFTAKPLFNKPNDTMEEPIILTENAELYQFKGYPECKIIEIQVPKNDEIKERKDGYKVWYKNESGELWAYEVGKDGKYRDHEHPSDIILKPVPKIRSMTHKEVLELVAKNAVFHNGMMGAPNGVDTSFEMIIGYSANTQEYHFLAGAATKLIHLTTGYLYSIDGCKTWLPLTVEET